MGLVTCIGRDVLLELVLGVAATVAITPLPIAVVSIPK